MEEYAFYFDEESGEVSVAGLPNVPESDVYPDGEWLFTVDSQFAAHTNLMPDSEKIPHSAIVPLGSWIADPARNDGIPFTGLMPVPFPNGAFKDVTALESVRIPETVKKIGNFSFSGTSLKSVKIAADCEYSDTSFPSGCAVEFYDSGEFSQVYDADGFALLDAEGARIYTRGEKNG